MKRILQLILLSALVSISAVSFAAQDPSKLIQFIAPHGGEVYVVGQTQKIQIATHFKAVTLELSLDGGQTFSALGTLNTRATNGFFAWTITPGTTTNAVLRASAPKGKSVVTVTSSGFSITSAVIDGAGGITTGELADASVTNAKLAEHAVTSNKISSGQSSSNFILAADGSGGTFWESLNSALPTVGAPYVLKTGDTMSGGLQISAATTGLTVTNDAANQSTISVGPTPPTNGLLSVGATQNSFNVSIFDKNPNIVLSDSGSGNTAAFIQFRDGDQLTTRAQLAAFSAAHATKPNWLSLSNFKAGPVVLSVNNTEAMRVDSTGNVGVATTAPNSILQVNGSFALPIRKSAGGTTLTANDYTVIMSGAGTTATLPDATAIAGRIYVIKNASVGAITLSAAATQTIDGSASKTVSTSTVVQSDGANWFIIN